MKTKTLFKAALTEVCKSTEESNAISSLVIAKVLTEKETIKQGPYQEEFSKYLYKLINTEQTKQVFKERLHKLFLHKYAINYTIRGGRMNNTIHLNNLLNVIWDEFIDIVKNKGIDTAIYIIFNRYEKNC